MKYFLLLAILNILSFHTNAYADADSHLQKGHQLKKQGQRSEAILEYEKALKLKPDYSPAILSLESTQNLLEIEKWRSTKISPKCQQKTQDSGLSLYCAQEDFAFKGNPIHPLIIKDLSTWISDKGDQVVAIDLLGSQDSNRYCCEDSIKMKDSQISFSGNDESSFHYRYLGKSSKGLHVLHTLNS